MLARKIKRTIVSALLVTADGKVFMGKKDPKKGGVYADCWHIPGGGVDEGESLLEGLIREIKEETGIDISKCKIELVDDKGKGESEKTLETGEKVLVEMQFNVFKVKLTTNADETEVNLEDDLVEYKWFNMEKIGDVKLTLPSEKLFTRLGII